MTANVRHNLCWVVAHYLSGTRRVYGFTSERKENSSMYLNLHGNFPGLRSVNVLLAAITIVVMVPVLAMSLRATTPHIESTLAQSRDMGFGKLP